MRTIKTVEEVELTVEPKELIEGKYLSFEVLSKKLALREKEQNLEYKTLRNKLYNSEHAGKLNTSLYAGIKVIDIEKPMKSRASIKLSFKVV